jgi:cytochrome c551/c552/cytochrome c553
MSRFTDRPAACAGVALRARATLLGMALITFASVAAAGNFPGVGRTATPAEIKAWDIDVRPDFKGLPPGAGSVAQGQALWDAKCVSCHGTFGESNEVFAPLVGGTTAEDIRTGRVKTLVTGDVARTTFMKLASISTLWDYIHRAMPWNAPKSLAPADVYAVIAYMLNLADIVPGDFVLSDRNIAEIQQKLPNRNGLTRDHGLWDLKGRPDVKNVACMRNCPTEARVASAMPEHARGSHGDLADQNREVGGVRGGEKNAPDAPALKSVAVAAVTVNMADLARRKACLGCHGVDKRLVGPAFTEVAARYKGDSGSEARLVEKLRKGSSGVWGAMVMPPNPDLAEGEARALIRWIIGGATP